MDHKEVKSSSYYESNIDRKDFWTKYTLIYPEVGDIFHMIRTGKYAIYAITN
jgi:hypothetical protein